MKLSIIYFFAFVIIIDCIIAQGKIQPNINNFPLVRLKNQLTSYHLGQSAFEKEVESRFILTMASNFIFNTSHPNFDNYGELYSAGSLRP